MPQPLSQDHLALIGSIAQVLHGNGQQTAETIRTSQRLAARFQGGLMLAPGWGELLLKPLQPGAARIDTLDIIAVTPNNVGINRVVAANALAEQVIKGRLAVPEAQRRIAAIAAMPPLPDALFALACAAGAAALSVTFGVAHLAAVLIIFLSAGSGALVRRWLGRHGANGFAQAFVAALLAGMVGAASVRWNLSSDLRLIAVCPCMVLVPGPYLLNGTLDLLGNRMPLGMARLIFAAIMLAAISAGLLVAFGVLGIDLPPAPAGRAVALWAAVMAGALAAACFSIFFSMPLRLVGWPVLTAMIADGMRWAAMTWGHAGPVMGAGVAGLVVGAILTPVARRHHLPFAGIGFASVVSLMPGVLVFRMAGGLLALPAAVPADVLPLLQATVSDGLTALMVIAAMTIGIVMPKHAFDTLSVLPSFSGRRRCR
ncbi:MAG: threonine/serine exporter family protein [Duganella sp.]